jgi:chaperonin GroES
MKLMPTEDRILVLANKPPEKTAGGIMLPAMSMEEQNRGTVVATGPGRLVEDGSRLPMYIRIGDDVKYSTYGASEKHREDGVDYLMMRQTEVSGVYCKDVQVVS